MKIKLLSEIDGDQIDHGDNRIKKMKLNMGSNLFSIGSNFLSLLLIVPVTMNYMGEEIFGLWMFLSGVITLLFLADFGVGVGLQQRIGLNTDITKDKIQKSISSCFFMTAIVCIVICLILIIAQHNFTGEILKIQNEANVVQFKESVLAVAVGFIFFLPMTMFQKLLDALQLSYISNILIGVGRLCALFLIWIGVNSGQSLWYFVFFYMSMPYLILLTYYLYILNDNEFLLPNLDTFSFKEMLLILGIAKQSFGAQLGAVIMVSCPAIILGLSFGVSKIVGFALCQRLVNVLSMTSSVVLNPLWPAYSNAYRENDSLWIKTTFINSIVVSVLLGLVVSVIIYFVGDYLFRIWTGNDQLNVGADLILLTSLWVFIIIQTRVFSMFLNGLGEMKYQAIYGLLFPILAVTTGYLLSQICDISTIVLIFILVGELMKLICLVINSIYVYRHLAVDN
jgi:O-antigen/teichoic acid export membrane protein